MAKKKTEKAVKNLKESANKIWLAGLGALEVAEEEGSKLFSKLVERGEAVEKAGRQRVDKVEASLGKAKEKAQEVTEKTWERFEAGLDRKIAGALESVGVPTRDEIRNLTRRVEQLTEAVAQLHPAQTPAKTPKKAAPVTSARKAPAKRTASTKTTTRRRTKKPPTTTND